MAEISCRETEIGFLSAISAVRSHYSMEMIQNQTYVRKIYKKALTKNRCSCNIQAENEEMFGVNGGENMERRTQRRVVRKSRKIRKNIFLLLTLALILCLGTFAMGAQKGKETKTYYESVMIQKGDTIWDIAEEYKTERQKTEQMVDAIREVNGLKTANIRTGENIIVPVTKEI